ncbi:MAG TPA: DinB family protein [Micromonospora sp.]|nr:DinB family protein [Micromonospora sp.]
MAIPFPSPTVPAAGRTEVFIRYLDYFREAVLAKVSALPEEELRSSRLPSGWSPLELLKHLRYVELRWIEWGFQGRDVGEPWGDRRGDRWHIAPEETRDDLMAALRAQGAHTRAVVEASELSTPGKPSPRWDGADPPPLERVLFHLLQEYARHLGHLDIVVELAGGPTGDL